MTKTDFAFGKENYLLIAVSVLIIIIGFVLMSGGGSPEEVAFNPAIFAARRIVVAPVVCMIGFVMMVVAILINSKGKKTEE